MFDIKAILAFHLLIFYSSHTHSFLYRTVSDSSLSQQYYNDFLKRTKCVCSNSCKAYFEKAYIGHLVFFLKINVSRLPLVSSHSFPSTNKFHLIAHANCIWKHSSLKNSHSTETILNSVNLLKFNRRSGKRQNVQRNSPFSRNSFMELKFPRETECQRWEYYLRLRKVLKR